MGNFYDEEGNPTAALRSAEKMIAEAEEEKDRRKVEQRKYPFCNSESSSGKARVWCSKRRYVLPFIPALIASRCLVSTIFFCYGVTFPSYSHYYVISF